MVSSPLVLAPRDEPAEAVSSFRLEPKLRVQGINSGDGVVRIGVDSQDSHAHESTSEACWGCIRGIGPNFVPESPNPIPIRAAVIVEVAHRITSCAQGVTISEVNR